MAVPKYIVVACKTNPASPTTAESSTLLESKPSNSSREAASLASSMLTYHRTNSLGSSSQFGPSAPFIDVQIFVPSGFAPDDEPDTSGK